MNNEVLNNQKLFIADIPAIIKSIFIVLIISCVLITPIRNISFNSPSITSIDQRCIEYLDQTLKRATIAYGLCRATNAIVSVLQKIEIGVEAVGTVTFSPFEWLDPLNDLVERFSWILLAAMASIGIQEFFIRLFPESIINFILLPGLFMWLTGMWLNKYFPINILAIGKHLVLLAVVLRFIIPAEVAINNWIYDYHLKNKYNQSIDNIKTSVKEIKKRTPVEEISMEDSQEEQSQVENGFFSRTKKAIAALGDLGGKFKEFQLWLKTEVPDLFENFISLIMVFIISTIFLPIFILWLIVYLIRIITNSQFGHQVEKKFKINIFQKKS